MKKNNFLLLSIVFFLTACNNDEAEINIGTQENPVTFTTRADATDGVSVLIFGKEQTANEYKTPFTPQWVNGTAYKTLYLGTYNFLFYKWEEKGNVTTTPIKLEGGTEGKVEDIRFNAIADAIPGYHKPVEKIWLPVKAETATKEYTITGNNNPTISETIQNVTSKVDVIIKRGIKNVNGEYEEFGIDQGAKTAILDDIENITIDIDKVGTSVGIGGTYGTSKTKVENIIGKEYNPDGGTYNGAAAIFGEFVVFPNEKAETSTINIKVTPKTGTPYEVMNASVEGKLERDKKLEITIWLTATYKFIIIEVVVKDLEKTEPGEVGIWE